MTPEEARRLLDGTTPGPWELSSSRSVVGIDIVMYDGTEMERQNVALASAAPALAAMIAGMTTEYRHEVQSIADGTWHPLTEWTEGEPDRRPWNVTPTRIVRRYVTDTEEEA